MQSDERSNTRGDEPVFGVPEDGASASPPPIAPPMISPPTEPQREEPVHVVLDADGRVAQSVACRSCGYDLQGLSADANCPECGSPIERSLTSDRLMFANPDWLARVARGIGTILIGIGLMIVVSIGAAVVIAIVAAQGGNFMMAATVVGVVGAAFGLVIVLGAWWATTPEPGVHEERPVNVRTVARYCMLTQVFSGALNLAFGPNTGMTTPAGLTPSQLTAAIVGQGIGLIAVVGYVALLLHIGRMAARLPSQTLASQHRVAGWGLGISQALGAVFAIILFVVFIPAAAVPAGGPAAMNPAMGIFAGIGGCVVGLASLTFTTWAIVLAIIMWNRLRYAAAQAQAAWQRSAGL